MLEFFSAMALVLVIEGILPFISPDKYRSAVKSLMELDDSTLRKIGLGSMAVGLVLLYLIRS